MFQRIAGTATRGTQLLRQSLSAYGALRNITRSQVRYNSNQSHTSRGHANINSHSSSRNGNQNGSRNENGNGYNYYSSSQRMKLGAALFGAIMGYYGTTNSTPSSDEDNMPSFSRVSSALSAASDILSRSLESFYSSILIFADSRTAYKREVYAWGSTQFGQLGLGIQTGDLITAPQFVSALSRVNPVKVVANNETAMVITDAGEVFLWGRGDNYVLGPQQLRNMPTPTRLQTGYEDPLVPPQNRLPGGMPRIVNGAISRTHGCGIDEYGRLWTWGARAIGRAARAPSAVKPQEEQRTWWGSRVVAPASSSSESYRLSSTGDAIPVPALGHPYEPRPINHPEWNGRRIKSVACGLNHTIAVLDDGRVFAWGTSSDGALGLSRSAIMEAQAEQKQELDAQGLRLGEDLPRDLVLNPTEVKGQLAHKRAVKVACGKRHTVVLCEDGSVFTFGDDGYGQMGQGPLASRCQTEPSQVDTLQGHHVIDVSAGESHTACVTSQGQLFSWGLGGDGQMGVGGKVLRNPLPVLNLDLAERKAFIKAVSCGGGHTAALDSKGDLWLFGRGQYGQLGRGQHVESAAAWRDRPVKLDLEAEGLGNVRVEQVSLGTDSSFALVQRLG